MNRNRRLQSVATDPLAGWYLIPRHQKIRSAVSIILFRQLGTPDTFLDCYRTPRHPNQWSLWSRNFIQHLGTPGTLPGWYTTPRSQKL